MAALVLGTLVLLHQATLTDGFLIRACSVKHVGRHDKFQIKPTRRCETLQGDDFAGYGNDESLEEGAASLAKEFYQELKIRKKFSGSQSLLLNEKEIETSTTIVNRSLPQSNNKSPGSTRRRQRSWPSAGLFDGRQRMTVYSSAATTTAPTMNTQGSPLPPRPTYGSPTQLSVSGIIAVIILSRYFWIQALVSIGLIALYVAMVAATSNGGGDWMGASTGNTMDWSSSSSSTADVSSVVEQSTNAKKDII